MDAKQRVSLATLSVEMNAVRAEIDTARRDACYDGALQK